jgi:glycosyltransferase involved in cell wall biosynthesis
MGKGENRPRLQEVAVPATEFDAATAAIRARADAIYFLMAGGWARELRSNRWHYASRWARHLPVVLVQEVNDGSELSGATEPEPRIPNCRVLYVRSANSPSGLDFLYQPTQARQIYADMQAHGIKRPILWIYSSNYVESYSLIPAVLRVHHASENYFSFDHNPPGYLRRLRAVLKQSDLVIAVSEGVAAAYRRHAGSRLEVVNNGCDYPFYARGGKDAALAEARKRYRKLAVYAGNINERLDFTLIERCVRECADVFFAFFGPVAGLSGADRRIWERLLSASNCKYFGTAEVDRLPGIYGTADVGLMPYKQTPPLVDNLFPLKCFEMQATGLPVVTTPFKSLSPY